MGPAPAAPVVWQPSQYWDGDLGSWSSFALRVGNPQQTVRVIPSTAGQSTWVIAPAGCHKLNGTPTHPNCRDARGELFNVSQSTSWHALSNNTLDLNTNLGLGHLVGLYGLDTVALGFSDSIGGPTLDSQVVTLIEPQYYLDGLFGLNNQPTNLSEFSDPHPSALTTMKRKNLIPSLSWGYTAGAPYRESPFNFVHALLPNFAPGSSMLAKVELLTITKEVLEPWLTFLEGKGVFGSLTFGGYDASRFEPNNVSFTLAPDITRDLVVELRLILATTANGSIHSLLPSPMLTFIDSSQIFIYLPLESCQAFEKVFGLIWDNVNEMYWVDDAQHQFLLELNPTVNFTISDSENSRQTVDMVLPYDSFDLQETTPAAENSRRFFPLRRAANETQYRFGRTFFQEAYIITDYERSNFSVSQAKFHDGVPSKIIPIDVTLPSPTQHTTQLPPMPSHTVKSHRNPTELVGFIIGALEFILLVILFAGYLLRKRRQKLLKQTQIGPRKGSIPSQTLGSPVLQSVPEIGTNSALGLARELPSTSKAELATQKSANKTSKATESDLAVPQELRTTVTSEVNVLAKAAQTNLCAAAKVTKTTATSHFSRCTPSDASSLPPEMPALPFPNADGSSKSSTATKFSIYASYMRRSLNLDRSLPPTPISDSPVASPIASRHKSHWSHRRSRSLDTMPHVPRSALLVRKMPMQWNHNSSLGVEAHPQQDHHLHLPISVYFKFAGVFTSESPRKHR